MVRFPGVVEGERLNASVLLCCCVVQTWREVIAAIVDLESVLI